MTFTALEALLLSAFVSALVGIAVRVCSVSPSQCASHRELLSETIRHLRRSNDIQFRMLRLLVSHLELPADVKAEILNMGPSE